MGILEPLVQTIAITVNHSFKYSVYNMSNIFSHLVSSYLQPIGSLHSKRFHGVGEHRNNKERTGTVFCPHEIGVKIRGRAKIRKRGWGRGRGGEGRKCLWTNPWILKTSICQRMELVSSWTSQTLLTCVDHRIKKGKLVYKNFSPKEASVMSFDSTVKIL